MEAVADFGDSSSDEDSVEVIWNKVSGLKEVPLEITDQEQELTDPELLETIELFEETVLEEKPNEVIPELLESIELFEETVLEESPIEVIPELLETIELVEKTVALEETPIEVIEEKLRIKFECLVQLIESLQQFEGSAGPRISRSENEAIWFLCQWPSALRASGESRE